MMAVRALLATFSGLTQAGMLARGRAWPAAAAAGGGEVMLIRRSPGTRAPTPTPVTSRRSMSCCATPSSIW